VASALVDVQASTPLFEYINQELSILSEHLYVDVLVGLIARVWQLLLQVRFLLILLSSIELSRALSDSQAKKIFRLCSSTASSSSSTIAFSF
jgi:hypothetical protein